ncbi:flavin monoamine oxidase family protein [Sphingosinicella terrae]|uniref:flavin monoamine oxidase family protein n=1 Tax=Sphingosinicella terrae TaxID=2172047 RepID=UPI000E0DC930|nr:FAD-dependent oxidoreductase [Sphingosinicella terrae]
MAHWHSNPEIVVIGAGAAGIAAGRRLAGRGRSFLIVEASDRIGGRAHTVEVAGMPLDLGCGWLHSADRNPWTRTAEAAGLTVDRSPPAWGRQYRDLGFSREEQRAAAEAWEAFDRRLRESPPPSDRASDALEPHGAWNAYLNARSTYVSGAELDRISIQDMLAYDDADSGANWRLPGGYGALIAATGCGLPVAFGAPVERIDRHGARLRLETPKGALSAQAIIVTVPTPLLCDGGLRFDPPLHDKLEAAESLPLGLADKLFLALDDAEDLAPDSQVIGNPRSQATGSYYLRPFGRPLIEAFFGGEQARTLETEGEAAAAAFAAEELAGLFGNAFARRLRPLAATAWGSAAFSRGSYSHALPGRAEARERLAAPVEGRIFFAGEACSRADYSTAHGARVTGIAAAEAALAAVPGQ